MKSLRYLSTIGALAMCAVFASAQDSGLGRGHGGGGGRDRDSGSHSRQSSPPSDSRGRSSSPQDNGRSRDRNDAPSDRGRSGPSQDGGLGRGRSRDNGGGSNSGPSRDQGPSRDRGNGGGSNSGPSRDQGPSRDRGNGGSNSGPSRDQGPSRDRGNGGGSNSGPSRDQGPSRDRGNGGGSNQDSGLGRGRSRDNGGSGGSGPSRDRGNSGGSTRDRGNGSSGGWNRGSDNRGSNPDFGRSRGNSGRNPSQPSRSGTVNYQNNTNITVRVDNRGYRNPSNYGVIRTNSMEFKALRQDFPRQYSGLYYNGWRTGYYHYNQYWRDNYFWYPHYCATPFVTYDVVVSPWYCYTFLPGYLSCDHVIVSNYRGYWGWNVGFVYVYDNRSYNNNYNRDLDYATEDLRDGFERRDFRALERLVPDRGQVAIFRDGRYDYSIDARDFDDLIHDLSSNADTNEYRILETRTNRDSARISAVHTYTDQWGNRQQVYHSIYLQEEDGKMVIREFGTSNYRVW